MQLTDLTELLRGYYHKTLSDAQRAAFFELIRDDAHQAAVETFIDELLEQEEPGAGELPDTVSNDILQSIFVVKKTFPASTKPVRSMGRWWLAAAVLLVVLLGALVWRQPAEPSKAVAHTSGVFVPGVNGAILTLPGEQQVSLDGLPEDTTVLFDKGRLVVQQGQVAYDPASAASELHPVYHTISTPRGRQFTFRLPDGSRIWLNAASSVRFPIGAGNRSRTLAVTGEVYCEVQQDANAIFRVQLPDGSLVQVLGTQFNINAYSDEPRLKTTLVSGRIRLVKNGRAMDIQPGQQAITGHEATSGMQLVTGADADNALAWTTGKFNMKQVTVAALARQIARWYDIDVVVDAKDALREISFGGALNRSLPLTDLLLAMKDLGVQSKIVNKQLQLYKE